MSTPCNIGVLSSDNSVRFIYCHFDGYIKGVGLKLKESYNSEEAANSLIDLGDISSLGSKLAPDGSKHHSFDSPQPDVTVAYHRDRKDDWMTCKPESAYNPIYYARHCNVDYCYLYDTNDNCWKVLSKRGFSAY